MPQVFKPSELKEIRAAEELRTQRCLPCVELVDLNTNAKPLLHELHEAKDDEHLVDTSTSLEKSESSISVEQSPSRQSLKRKSDEPPASVASKGSKTHLLTDDRGELSRVESDTSATAEDDSTVSIPDKRQPFAPDTNNSATARGASPSRAAVALEEPVDEIRSTNLILKNYIID